jgi:hypothetical protein
LRDDRKRLRGSNAPEKLNEVPRLIEPFKIESNNLPRHDTERWSFFFIAFRTAKIRAKLRRAGERHRGWRRGSQTSFATRGASGAIFMGMRPCGSETISG